MRWAWNIHTATGLDVARWVLLALLVFGSGGLVYIILWIALPEDKSEPPAAEIDSHKSKHDRVGLHFQPGYASLLVPKREWKRNSDSFSFSLMCDILPSNAKVPPEDGRRLCPFPALLRFQVTSESKSEE